MPGLRANGGQHSRLAVVSAAIESGRRISRILACEDGGLVLLDRDTEATDPDELEEGALLVVCEDCLVERHPEAAEPMRLAREHGDVQWLDDGWVAG